MELKIYIKLFFIPNLPLEKHDVQAKKFLVYFKYQIETYINEKHFQQQIIPHFHKHRNNKEDCTYMYIL